MAAIEDMKMQRLLMGTAVVLLLLWGGIAMLGFISGSERSRVILVSPNLASPIDQSMVDDLAVVPKFPGATLAEDIREGYTWRRIKFRVPIDIEKMFQFYSKALTRNGWSYVSEDFYTWADPKRQVPWHLDVYLGGEAFEDGTSGVTFILSRWATVEKLPVYPKTNQFTLTTKNEQGSRIDALTYETYAAPEQLVEFYKEKLTIYGWNLVEQPQPQSNLGSNGSTELFFASFRNNSNGNTIQMSLWVLLASSVNGQTRVELKATGAEIDWGNF